MTAKPGLLPLPDVKLWRAMKDRNGNVGYSDKPDPKYSESAGTDSLTWVRLNDHTAAMRDYARANLAELQREVEGLRAEVAELLTKASEHRDGRLAALERAERLAGALRDAANDLGRGVSRGDVAAHMRARAALDQETTNG